MSASDHRIMESLYDHISSARVEYFMYTTAKLAPWASLTLVLLMVAFVLLPSWRLLAFLKGLGVAGWRIPKKFTATGPWGSVQLRSIGECDR